MIDRLLDDGWAFSEFAGAYYTYYIDALPEEALNPSERDFLSAAQEKLDWTDERADQESRDYGWITPDEYITWLRTAREEFDTRTPN